MARKKGSKALWIDGNTYAQFKKKLAGEGWHWGLTKKLEVILAAYIAGESDIKTFSIQPKHLEPAEDKPTPKQERERRSNPSRRIGYYGRLRQGNGKPHIIE